MRGLVVFDPDYGKREDADLGDAFWLVESPDNRALATQAWQAGATDSNSAVFKPAPHLKLDDEALDRFRDADLHHPDWNEMTFAGVPLSSALRREFAERGLQVAQTETGFLLHR